MTDRCCKSCRFATEELYFDVPLFPYCEQFGCFFDEEHICEYWEERDEE